MRRKRCDKYIPVNPSATISLALSKYHFSTADIGEMIRFVTRTIPSKWSTKRLSRSDGSYLKQGRPPIIPKVKKDGLYSLIEVTGKGFNTFSGNTLHFLHHIELQFGLTPRQYINWVATFMRHGKYLMRRCLLCGDLFPSLESADRHCRQCLVSRRQLLREDGQSIFASLQGNAFG